MTIRDWICKNDLLVFTDRLEKLEAIGAPQVMIDAQRKAVEELNAGELKIAGDTKLLDIEIEFVAQKKGKGGKPYIQINNCVNYFPNAKFGRYINTAS